MSSNYALQWDASYSRGENHIHYPQVEVVKFINRFVVNRHSNDETSLRLKSDYPARALDFACGIGTHSFLLAEFGLDVIGLDISANAIKIANERAQNILSDNQTQVSFNKIDGPSDLSDYDDDFFNITIAESCLDSMSFELALEYIKEIKRVTSHYLYLSLISSTGRHPTDEIVVDQHECGTVQSYYDEDRIDKLLGNLSKSTVFFRKVTETAIGSPKFHNERYFLVVDLAK